MAKPKPTYCKNCGEKVDCKTFNKTGKACRKGKSIGKNKGKAISKKTLEKREKYDSMLGDFHTDYLNHMRNKQFKKIINKETGEIIYKEGYGKTYSFVRYLNVIGEESLRKYFTRNYKDLNSFNFKDN